MSTQQIHFFIAQKIHGKYCHSLFCVMANRMFIYQWFRFFVLSLTITRAFTTETKLIYFKVKNELMLQKDGEAPYKFFACLLQAHCSVMRCCNNVLVTTETDRKAHSLDLYPCTGCCIVDSFTSRNFNTKNLWNDIQEIRFIY